MSRTRWLITRIGTLLAFVAIVVIVVTHHNPAPTAKPVLSEVDTGFAQDIDAMILARAQRGDMAAFEEIYRRYGRACFQLALRLTGQRQTAEDLVHEAFLKMMDTIAGYRGEAPFGAWFKRLTANAGIDWLRRQRHVADTGAEASFEQIAAAEADPAGLVDADVERESAGLGALGHGAQRALRGRSGRLGGSGGRDRGTEGGRKRGDGCQGHGVESLIGCDARGVIRRGRRGDVGVRGIAGQIRRTGVHDENSDQTGTVRRTFDST